MSASGIGVAAMFLLLQLSNALCVHAFQSSSSEFVPRRAGGLIPGSFACVGRRKCCRASTGGGCDNNPIRLRMGPPLTQDEINGGDTDVNVDTTGNGDDANLMTIELEPAASTAASPSTSGITALSSTRQQLPTNWLGEKNYILFAAILIGLFTGTNIAVFKTAVEFVREIMYGEGTIVLPMLSPALWNSVEGEMIVDSIKISEVVPTCLIPVFGGLFVGLLLKFGGDMPPGLRDTVKEVDLDAIRASNSTQPMDLMFCNIPPTSERNDILRFTRKAFAATATLGTGNSLGPEGPSVEAGMSFSRLLMNNQFLNTQLSPFVFGTFEDNEMNEADRVDRKMARDRLLLACGAAAGVSAGFNAPLSGVFFALEIVQNALVSIDLPVQNDANGASANGDDMQHMKTATVGGEALALQQINISAILLASVVSALTIQLLLGSELALRVGTFDFNNPLLELPLYLLLGGMAGITAAIFSGVAQSLKNLVDGAEGPESVRNTFQSIPKYVKPLIGSVTCGIVGIFIPQVLFFGYETLNGLFTNTNFPTEYLFLLLVAKLFTTALCAATGLVGGTFAPSLFLGGVLGAGFHSVISDTLQSISHVYPELAAYPIFDGISGQVPFAMVGAASVLAALFRAPLTASLLLFECTRNYDVILPLMASAGVASLTGDIVEKWLDEEQRDRDPVSWGDLATRIFQTNDDDVCEAPDDGVER